MYKSIAVWYSVFMLDKRTLKFLRVIAKICEDGSYKIIEKSFLTTEMNPKKTDAAALDQMVRFLQDNEMIDVKYSDEGVYCLSVLPKGRVANEGGSRAGGNGIARTDVKGLVLLAIAVFLASFVGAILGTLLAGAF